MKHLIIALVLLFNVFIPFNKSSANLSARGYKDDVSRWYPLGYYDEYLSWNYSCN